MKNFLYYVCRILFIPMVFIGCTHSFKSAGMDELQSGSPLRGVNTRSFYISEFKDIRGVENPLIIGKWSGFQFKLDKSVSSIVTQAIKNEFERNGHIFKNENQQSQADLMIDGTIYKYLIRLDRGFFTNKVTAEISIKMTINDNLSNNNFYIMNYEGESHVEGMMPLNAVTGPTPLDLMNRAQMAMLKDISTDLKLVEFLKNCCTKISKLFLDKTIQKNRF